MFSAQKCPGVAASRAEGSGPLGAGVLSCRQVLAGTRHRVAQGGHRVAQGLKMGVGLQSSHSSRSHFCSLREVGVIPRLQANVFWAKF